jgi:hypothetical protein
MSDPRSINMLLSEEHIFTGSLRKRPGKNQSRRDGRTSVLSKLDLKNASVQQPLLTKPLPFPLSSRVLDGPGGPPKQMKNASVRQPLSMSRWPLLCHPDRSEAKRRDLRFYGTPPGYVFSTERSRGICSVLSKQRRPKSEPLSPCHPACPGVPWDLRFVGLS